MINKTYILVQYISICTHEHLDGVVVVSSNLTIALSFEFSLAQKAKVNFSFLFCKSLCTKYIQLLELLLKYLISSFEFYELSLRRINSMNPIKVIQFKSIEINTLYPSFR